MSFIKKTEVRAALIIAALFVYSALAQAQSRRPTYNFLEFQVTDSFGRPVAAAEVAAEDNSGPSRKELTDQQGKLEKGLPFCLTLCHTTGLTVSKPGYYTFTDVFGVTQSTTPISLELLVIPKTPDEARAIGSEELKREIFVAARQGDVASVSRLLKAGIDPNLKASELRGIPLTGYVLPENVGVDKLPDSRFEETPLILFAALSNDVETIKTLLSTGAKIRPQEIRSKILLAYFYSMTKPYWYTFPFTLPDSAAAARYDEGVKILVKAGAEINSQNSLGTTPLMIAATRLPETVKLLIRKEAHINAEDFQGKTALIHAIDMIAAVNFSSNAVAPEKTDIQLGIINYLLESGADPNLTGMKTKNGPFSRECETPLIAAVYSGNLDVIKLLIKFKANVNFVCASGETPLSFARRKTYSLSYSRRAQVVALLETSGAK